MSERPSIDPNSPELREMLTAYLDGELDAESASQVEQLLASHPCVEAELRQLERAWILLDRLPQAEVAPSFTRSTMEMAALAVEEELQSRVASRRAMAAIAVAIACLAGFTGARLWPDANRRLLRDLPIIENLEACRQTPDIDFLRRLQREAVFANETIATAASFDMPREQLRSLGPQQREELHRKYERLVHLPEAEQNRLRALQTTIGADRESAALQTTLAKYQAWLQDLSGVERAELMALDADSRWERVRRLRQEESRRLSAADLQAFVAWLERRLAKWLEEKPAAFQRDYRAAPDWRRRELMGRALNELRRSRPFAFAGIFADSAGRAELREALSSRGRRQLDGISAPEERRRLLQTWFAQAFSPQSLGRGRQLSLPTVDDDELKRFFQSDLDSAQRAQLLNLPADQMRRQLLRLYQTRR